MPATETDNLNVFKMRVARCDHGALQHPGVVIVDNIQRACVQRDIVKAGQRIHRQNGHAKAGQHGRQIMVDKGVRLIRPGGQHHSILSGAGYLIQYLLPGLLHLAAECLLGFVAGRNGSPG